MKKRELSEHVVELETRIAFQEETLSKLDDALVRQQREMDRIARQLEALLSQVEELAARGVEDDEPPPPHY